MKNKYINKSKYEEIEEKFIIRLKQVNLANIPISGIILNVKAGDIAKKMMSNLRH